MAYDAVLLDYDGVIVRVLDGTDRTPAFRDQLSERFRNERLDFDDRVADSLAYSVSPGQLRELSDRTGLDAETLWRHRDDALSEVLRSAALDGKKSPYDDVDALFELDVPLGIASNNQQRVVEFITSEYGLSEQFETIHARDPHPSSLNQKKPEPTYLEAAIADLQAENPLYVGDKGTDILAGERVGIDTVLLRRRHNADRTVEATPTYEVSSLDAVAEIVESESEDQRRR